MKKLGIVLIITLCCLKFSTVFAYDFSTVSDGQTLYYNIISDSTVEVTSENEEYPYYTTFPTGDIFIPSFVSYNGNTYTVVQIGESAFLECLNLINVNIANTVIHINGGAFAYDTSLTFIRLPDSLIDIGICAFRSCIKLTTVDFPSTLLKIQLGAFLYCMSLDSITIPENVREIGYGAFNLCKKLIAIDVSNNNQYFKMVDGLLYNYNMDTLLACLWTKKGALILPESVLCIDTMACSECENLTSIVFNSSLKSIAKNAFCLCSGLSGKLELPKSLMYIGENAFYSCDELNDTLIIPDSVKIIDYNAFSGCIRLENFIFGKSLEIIGESAFNNCINIRGPLNFPTKIRRIESYAFLSCGFYFYDINSIFIGDSIEYIGPLAFSSIDFKEITIGSSIDTMSMCGFNPDVKKITIKAQKPPVSIIDTYNNCYIPDSAVLYVPCGSKQYYQADTYFNKCSSIQEGDMSYAINLKVNNNIYGEVIASVPDCITNQAILTATPAYYCEFYKWSDGDTSNPRTITVTCDTTFMVEFVKKTGIKRMEKNNFSLYPNPANNQLTLDNGQSEINEVCIYDILGRQVKQVFVNEVKTTVDISDLPVGMYVLKINTEEEMFTRKVQIIR